MKGLFGFVVVVVFVIIIVVVVDVVGYFQRISILFSLLIISLFFFPPFPLPFLPSLLRLCVPLLYHVGLDSLVKLFSTNIKKIMNYLSLPDAEVFFFLFKKIIIYIMISF